MISPDNRYAISTPGGRNKAWEFLAVFKPRPRYFITPLIIDLNIAVYLFLLCMGADPISPSSDVLLKWGANFAPLTFDGQWWRLFTCCFLHFGLLHIAMNMYAFYYIGLLLEPLLGKTRFLVAYILCGLLSSLASLWWNTLVVSAGASGAIFGMYGLFLALLTTNLIAKQYRQGLLNTMIIFVVFNLAFGAAGNIDSAAHIGGLLAGLAIGYLYYPSIVTPRLTALKFATVALLTLCVGAGSVYAFQRMPRDGATYYSLMNKFDALDEKTSDATAKLSTLPQKEILAGLKNQARDYQQGIALLQQTKTLNISQEDHQHAEKLIDYCNLKIQGAQLYYRAINENTDRYDAQVEAINQKLAALVKGMGGS